MKNLQKETRQIRLPTINFNRLVAQSQELIRLKKESDKNYKLTQGMMLALDKMDKEVQKIKNPEKNEEHTEQIL